MGLGSAGAQQLHVRAVIQFRHGNSRELLTWLALHQVASGTSTSFVASDDPLERSRTFRGCVAAHRRAGFSLLCPYREAAVGKIDAVRFFIEMDYVEQGKSKQPHDNVKALVAVDRSSGAIFASGIMQKGDDGGYVTQSLSGLLPWDTRGHRQRNQQFVGFETGYRPI